MKGWTREIEQEDKTLYTYTHSSPWDDHLVPRISISGWSMGLLGVEVKGQPVERDAAARQHAGMRNPLCLVEFARASSAEEGLLDLVSLWAIGIVVGDNPASVCLF